MKKRIFWENKLFMASAMVLLSLVFIVPRAGTQELPYYNPFLGISSLAYFSFFPFTSPLFAPAAFRFANTPTAVITFPAPALPPVPAATIGGVGITSLIPTVAVTQPVSLTALITTPLSPLITYTPLSLVGLTFAPVPTSAPLAASPLVLP